MEGKVETNQKCKTNKNREREKKLFICTKTIGKLVAIVNLISVEYIAFL